MGEIDRRAGVPFPAATRHVQDAAAAPGSVAQAILSASQQMIALMSLSSSLLIDLHELQRRAAGIVERVAGNNLRAMAELVSVTNPGGILERPQRLAGEAIATLLPGAGAGATTQRTGAGAAPQGRTRAETRTRRVADVMDHSLFRISPGDSVEVAVHIMRSEDVSVVAVAENDLIIGLLSDRDIAIRVAGSSRNAASTTVREVMTPEVRYLFEDEDLEQAARTMGEQTGRHLPVINRKQRLVGMVSLGDLPANGHTEDQPLTSNAALNAGRVLLVDDEKDVLYLASQFLEKAGFSVSAANSGDAALALLATGMRFDALVTDFAMPGFSGGHLVALAREMQPELPAIVMTGFPEVDTSEIAQFATVVRKPFQRQELVTAVTELIAAATGDRGDQRAAASAAPGAAGANAGAPRPG
jgi:CheY-like chemotaxis protein/CBS domain-containing protein